MELETDYLVVEQRCIERARRSVNFLLEQQGPDGGWKNLPDAPMDAYYKASWAFGLMGEPVAAERSLDYVKTHFLQPDGDLQPREKDWFINVHYQYQHGWTIIGAHKLGRYDVSAPAMRFLLGQQDPHHGGFYGQRAAAGERKRSDTMSSGIAGIACLVTGQMEAAEKLAGYFERMIDMQPAPDARFYSTFEPDGSLGVEFGDDQAWRVVDTTKPNQVWYSVGLPFNFGILMHQATGDARYRRLAEWFFDFQSRCVNPWDGGSSGKAGWGCSMLYHHTGDARYREIALRVARNQMSFQSDDGTFRWGTPGGYTATDPHEAPRVLTNGDMDVTAEFTVWLALIGSNLLARDATT
jgi:hypothetical protein